MTNNVIVAYGFPNVCFTMLHVCRRRIPNYIACTYIVKFYLTSNSQLLIDIPWPDVVLHVTGAVDVMDVLV